MPPLQSTTTGLQITSSSGHCPAALPVSRVSSPASRERGGSLQSGTAPRPPASTPQPGSESPLKSPRVPSARLSGPHPHTPLCYVGPLPNCAPSRPWRGRGSGQSPGRRRSRRRPLLAPHRRLFQWSKGAAAACPDSCRPPPTPLPSEPPQTGRVWVSPLASPKDTAQALSLGSPCDHQEPSLRHWAICNQGEDPC